MELLKIKKALEAIKRENIKTETKKTEGAQAYARRGDWTFCQKEGVENGGEWVGAVLTNKQEKQAKTRAEYKKLLKDAIIKHEEKKAAEALARVERAETVEGFPQQIEICITWTSSRTWGNNPRAEMWAGAFGGYHKGRSVGGCGYCKRSTAAAEVLEDCEALQALALYELNKKDKATIKKALKGGDVRGVFAYGLRFSGGRVYFGAGCGMSSVLDELGALGYKTIAAREPESSSDFYILELKNNSSAAKFNKARARAC